MNCSSAAQTPILYCSIGLYVKGNGTKTFLTKHTLKGAQPTLIKGPLWKVGVCTLGVLLIVTTW